MISKQFTAAAILRLTERGKLSIDEPIRRYFPKLSVGDEVAVRHLLGHTSGIPEYTALDNFDQLNRTKATPEDVVQVVAERPPAFRAGDEWQ